MARISSRRRPTSWTGLRPRSRCRTPGSARPRWRRRVGRVPAVGGPGRGAELVEPVVAAGVHDLKLPPDSPEITHSLERAGGRPVRAPDCAGARRPPGRRHDLLPPPRSWPARWAGAGAGAAGRRPAQGAGRDLRGLDRERSSTSPALDLVGPVDLAPVGPVKDGPLVRTVVRSAGDRAERVARPDGVIGGLAPPPCAVAVCCAATGWIAAINWALAIFHDCPADSVWRVIVLANAGLGVIWADKVNRRRHPGRGRARRRMTARLEMREFVRFLRAVPKGLLLREVRAHWEGRTGTWCLARPRRLRSA